MKKLNPLLLASLALIAITSCKKTDVVSTPSANIVIANMVVGGGTLTLNTSAQTIANNASGSFPLFAGQTPVSLANNALTPAVNYYNQTIPVDNAGNYSLFLAGTSPTTVEPVLITEKYQNYTDSLCGVRFINLSPGSPAISVNITGQSTMEVTNLAYKAYSDFKQYPTKKVNPSYNFQIKNAGTGAVIASYTLTTPAFHNVTIALRGVVGGSPAPGVTLVTHP